jgi:Flp pilus assembly protein TadG
LPGARNAACYPFRDAARFARHTAATAAIEFAIVAPLMLAVALATLQAGVGFLVEAYFESAAEAAARIVLTNQASTLTASQFQTEVCNQLTTLFNCSQVVVELEPLPPGTSNLTALLPQFNASGLLQGTPAVDVGAAAGTPGTDMLLVVMYPWPVFAGPLGLSFASLGAGQMLMSSTQVFRIEPL